MNALVQKLYPGVLECDWGNGELGIAASISADAVLSRRQAERTMIVEHVLLDHEVVVQGPKDSSVSRTGA